MTAPSVPLPPGQHPTSASSIVCRLCDAKAEGVFSATLIGHHHVRYYRCQGCGSLQTEKPHWLDEAYANSNLAVLDTGVAQRNLNNLAAVYAVASMSGIRTVVDIGGGDGLLCRLLRDYGVDARLEDRYASNTYAQGFEADERHRPVMYTAFEVLEHYAEPKRDLGMIFDSQPDTVVVTTALYEGQGPEWWYIATDSGQHVFFYTREAMKIIAVRYGYTVLFAGLYTLFVRQQSGMFATLAARMAMSRIGTRILRSCMMLLPARGAVRDFERFAGHKLQ
jgi:hypothetical protein